MVERYNRISFAWGIPGLAVQVMAGLLDELLLGVLGTLLLVVGFAYYAKSRGRHPARGLFGLLSIVGLLVLACLSDRAKDKEPTHRESE